MDKEKKNHWFKENGIWIGIIIGMLIGFAIDTLLYLFLLK